MPGHGRTVHTLRQGIGSVIAVLPFRHRRHLRCEKRLAGIGPITAECPADRTSGVVRRPVIDPYRIPFRPEAPVQCLAPDKGSRHRFGYFSLLHGTDIYPPEHLPLRNRCPCRRNSLPQDTWREPPQSRESLFSVSSYRPSAQSFLNFRTRRQPRTDRP